MAIEIEKRIKDKVTDAYRDVYMLGYTNGYLDGKREMHAPPKETKRIVLRDVYDGENTIIFSVTKDVPKETIEGIISCVKSIQDYCYEDLKDMLERVLKDKFLGFESLGDEEMWW